MKAIVESLIKVQGRAGSLFASRLAAEGFSPTLPAECYSAALSEWRSRIEASAARLGCSPMRLLRHVIAECPQPLLGRFQAALRHWLDSNPLEPAAEHRQVVEFLRPHARLDPATRWLGFGGAMLGLAEYGREFDGTVETLLRYERLVLRPARGNLPLPTLEVLRPILLKSFGPQGGRRSFLNSIPRVSGLATCLEEGFLQGLSPLSRTEFDELPSAVRRWFLGCPALVSVGLDEGFRRDVASHPDSPEMVALEHWEQKVLPKALHAMRSGILSEADGFPAGFFRNPLALRQQEPIRQALRSRKHLFGPSADFLGQELPQAAIRRFDPRTRRLLQFHGARADQRLLGGPGDDLESLLQLVRDTTVGQLADAIHQCSSEGPLLDLVRLHPTEPAVREAMERVLGIPGLRWGLLRMLGRPVLQAAGEDTLVSILRANPDVVTCCDVELANRPEFGRALVRCFRSRDGAARVLHRLPGRAVSALLSETHPVVGLGGEIAQAGARSRNRPTRCAILALLVRHAPRLIEGTYGWVIPAGIHQDVARRALYHRRHGGLGALFRFTDRKGRPHWQETVRKTGATPALRRVLRRDRPDLIPELHRWDALRALKTPGFRRRLVAFLEGDFEVNLGLAPAALRHLVPWVRKRWIRQPTVALAYEIALVLSPRDARYLLALCTQRAGIGLMPPGGTAFDSLYRTVHIPKRSGGTRALQVPNPSLKRLQRRFLAHGFDAIPLHDAAHGFRKGRSILSNAGPHAGKPCVVNVDIEGFFPGTTYRNILRACSELADGALSPAARHVVADLCSYQGALPTGAPTSPAIGNIVLRAADAAISKAVHRFGVAYTRYADDLTFSGGTGCVGALRFVEKVLGELGYRLNAKKTNIFRRGRRQMVTGLVVNQAPHLPRRTRRLIRAAAHRAATGGEIQWNGRPMSRPELEGRIAFLKMVHPEEARELLGRLGGDGTPAGAPGGPPGGGKGTP